MSNFATPTVAEHTWVSYVYDLAKQPHFVFEVRITSGKLVYEQETILQQASNTKNLSRMREFILDVETLCNWLNTVTYKTVLGTVTVVWVNNNKLVHSNIKLLSYINLQCKNSKCKLMRGVCVCFNCKSCCFDIEFDVKY